MLYCSVAKFNLDAKLVSEPTLLDSIVLDDPRKIKLFSFIANANRSHIMTYTKRSENDQVVKVSSVLYDKKMTLLDKADMLIISPGGEDLLRSFSSITMVILSFQKHTEGRNRDHGQG